MPLTPIQHWFFEQERAEAHHFNQARLLHCAERVAVETGEQVVLGVGGSSRCAAPAICSHGTGLGAEQCGRGDPCVLLGGGSFRAAPEQQQRGHHRGVFARVAGEPRTCSRSAAARVSTSTWARSSRALAPGDPPSVCGWGVLASAAGGSGDGDGAVAAWGDALAAPQDDVLRRWAQRLQEYARLGRLQRSGTTGSECWKRTSASFRVDYAGGANTAASQAVVRVSLDAEETRALLLEVPSVYHTQINDVLLTALAADVCVVDAESGCAGGSGGAWSGGALRGGGPVSDGGLVHKPVSGVAGVAVKFGIGESV